MNLTFNQMVKNM